MSSAIDLCKQFGHVRPDKTSGLKCVQTVWHSDDILERIFQKKWFWKNSADDKKNIKNYQVGKVSICNDSKSCVKRPLSKRQKKWFSLNVGQKYCGMLQRMHCAILSTFIKLPLVIKTLVLPIFEWPFYTGFTVWGTYLTYDNYKIYYHKRSVWPFWTDFIWLLSSSERCTPMSAMTGLSSFMGDDAGVVENLSWSSSGR